MDQANKPARNDLLALIETIVTELVRALEAGDDLLPLLEQKRAVEYQLSTGGYIWAD